MEQVGCAICIQIYNRWEKGWPTVACPFRALIFLYRMLSIVTKCEMINVWDSVPAFIHISRKLLSADFLFENSKTGSDKLPWTYFISG